MKLLSASNLNGNRRLYQRTAISHSAEGRELRDVSAIRRFVKKDAVEPNRAEGRPTEAEIGFSKRPSQQAILPAGPSDWNHAMRMQLTAARRIIIINNKRRNKKGKPRHEEPKHHHERC